jgi:hypothetical protein
MLVRDWTTRGLRRGDLTALAAIARGRRPSEQNRRERLARRGFIDTASDDGPSFVTLRGRVALLLRKMTRR